MLPFIARQRLLVIANGPNLTRLSTPREVVQAVLECRAHYEIMCLNV